MKWRAPTWILKFAPYCLLFFVPVVLERQLGYTHAEGKSVRTLSLLRF